MALVALDGTPLVAIGQPWAQSGSLALAAGSSTLQDATNEACIQIGHIVTDDGGSHTIDTSGSSSLGWLLGAVTFANAATRLKVGLAAVDTANGPPTRASNATNVITFDVSKTYSAAPGSANAWIESVPDSGTKTIAHGDLVAFCTQTTAIGGVDAVNTVCGTISVATPRPSVTEFVGAAYGAATRVPNAVITFSDGHRGWFYGGSVFLTGSTAASINNASTPSEYGNLFQLPFPAKVYGVIAACNAAGDCNLVLYSDPLGTPTAQATISVDLNTVSVASARYSQFLFATPYSTVANTPVAAILKPTSATNVNMPYKSFNASAHQVTEMCGTNGYGITRSGGTGAFAAQNSSKDRFAIGLLVGAFDAGGSTGGLITSPGLNGGLQ